MSYWNTYAKQRLSRRRMLAATGAASAGAMLLAACGSNGNNGGGKGGSGENQLSKVEDTTSRAKPGGVWASFASSDTPGFDPTSNPASTVPPLANFAVSRLLKYKVGTIQNPPTGEVEGDAAASWEMAPDGLQLTMKLRQGMKFDARPPTSGRALTSEDVVYSWNKFAAISGTRTALANTADKGAPIVSMTAVDPQTVAAKLAFPYGPLLPMLAYHWYLVIQPTEAEDKFDARKDMRGSGPWILSKYEPSNIFQFVKNPDWYLKDRPFLDRIDMPIITEYATGVAQFEAGAIWQYTVNPNDILAVRGRHPDMLLIADGKFARTPPQAITFGWKQDSPFRDQRVRQAISMMLDRDALTEVNFAPSTFSKAGFSVPTRWHSHISAGEDGMWLNPQDPKEIGEGAKNFKFDVAEAKKLLSAAGKPGLETDFTYFSTNRYSNAWPRQGEVLLGMLNEGGLKANAHIVDYDSEYNPKYLNGKANYDGIAMLPSSAGPDIDTHFASKYTVNGRATYIAEPIPEISDLILAQRRELDRNKRASIIKDIQRQMAVYMPAVPIAGETLAFNLYWPQLANRGWLVGWAAADPAELFTQYWYDASKTPKK